MGIVYSFQEPTRRAISTSWLGPFLSIPDLDAIAELCQHDRQKGLAASANLRIDPTRSFYLVVSGEVAVYITSATEKLALVTAFRPGEAILLLPGMKCSESGQLICGDCKLSFQLRSIHRAAEVLSVSRQDMHDFLVARPHLKDLDFIVSGDCILEKMLLACPALQSLTSGQLQLLLTAAKLSYARPGRVVKLQEDPSKAASNSYVEKILLPIVGSENIALILAGRCTSVKDQNSLIKHFHHHVSMSCRTCSPILQISPLPPSCCDTLKLTQSSTSLLKVDPLAPTDFILGDMLGLGSSFVERMSTQTEAIVAVEGSWVAQWSSAVFSTLMRADPRIKRRLKRNFFMKLMTAVRDSSPLLQDMDDIELRAVCGRMAVHGFVKDERIFAQGSPARLSYIVLLGAVQESSNLVVLPSEGERNPSNTLKRTIVKSSAVGVASSRQGGAGALLGEASLIADLPYLTTASTLGKHGCRPPSFCLPLT